MTPEERIERALECAAEYGDTEGAHHKMWVIDQMVRLLTGCPTVMKTAIDAWGIPYKYDCLGESDNYHEFVRNARMGTDGPDTYDWDSGVIP